MKRTLILLLCLAAVSACRTQPKAVVDGVTLPEHPRLLYTEGDRARIGKLAGTTPGLLQLEKVIINDADSIAETVFDYTDEKKVVKGDAHTPLFFLAFAYRQTGDMKYAAKAEEILAHVSAFTEWCPDSRDYLLNSAITVAVAVAYDWCYEALSDRTRQAVSKAIYENALSITLKEYEEGDEINSWAKRETNWNIVCNCGMVLGALAVAEDHPEEAAVIVRKAEHYMPNCLRHFNPDGVCYEGPGYYEYTHIHTAMVLKALEDNFGTSGGVAELPGLDRTAQYYVDCVSPSGKVFNFADCSARPDASKSPLFFWFSRRYDLPEVAAWYRGQMDSFLSRPGLIGKYSPLAYAWYDDASCTDITPKPRMRTYHNINDILVLQGDSGNPGSIHVMAKGGDPDMPHQQADGGSFVIESEGQRWIDELGCDSYEIPGYFTYSPDDFRWKLFRESSLSHNTISIDGKCQHSRGTAHFCEENPTAGQPSATFDMTSLYPCAGSVRRQFTLTSDTSLRITDAVEAEGRHELRWTAATLSDVTINDSEITLSKNGKSFRIRIMEPNGAVFTCEPAKAFTEYEKNLDGITMIHCDIPFRNTAKIVMELTSEP